MMKHHDNDDEPLPFVQLAAATANVVRWLEKDRGQEPNGEADKAPEEERNRQREQQRFVETRLREIDRFERRFKPGYRNNRSGR